MLIKQVILRFPESGVVNKKYFLPPDAEINAGITRGFQIPVGNEISTSFSFTGITMSPITTTQIKNFTITICDSIGNEIYKDLVPYTFTVLNNLGNYRKFMNHKIDVSRSYVTFQDTTGITTASYILFNFFIQ